MARSNASLTNIRTLLKFSQFCLPPSKILRKYPWGAFCEKGQAYRRGADGGWEDNDGKGWSKAQGGETTEHLNQDQRAPSLGESREGSFGARCMAAGMDVRRSTDEGPARIA